MARSIRPARARISTSHRDRVTSPEMSIATSPSWNPKLYLAFEDERTRPARDLLARVPLDRPRTAVDIGCGPGNSTELLVERFPSTLVSGFDTSDKMIAEARGRLPTARFEVADALAWTPDVPVDLLFANAVFQWVPDHKTLFPRLMRSLAKGGVLAIQMPDNLNEPSHRLMREVADSAPFRADIGGLTRQDLLTTNAYYDLLQPLSDHVDVFRVVYYHVLSDAAAIVQWVSGTGLRPYLDRLPPEKQAAFSATYLAEVAKAYPPLADGRVMFAFPRLFIIARAKS